MASYVRFGLNLSPEVNMKIEARASKLGLTKSAFIIHVLAQHFDKEDQQARIMSDLTSKISASMVENAQAQITPEILAMVGKMFSQVAKEE